jgi:hypothetical protein
VIDWLLSALWYSSFVTLALGIVAVIRPIRRIRLATRWRSAALIVLSIAWMALNVVVLPDAKRVFLQEANIDAYAPLYHFREVHTRMI